MKKIKSLITNTRAFLNEVAAELRKCAWPTWSELQESTIVVIVSVVIFAIFIGVSDTFFNWVLALVIR